MKNTVQAWQAEPFAQAVIAYYHQFGRKDLPWHKSSEAYPIWLSEIMLQQTQVATVIPYYEKFLQAFPTVHDLALASDDEVMNLWSGLGYYNRARNLHKTAKIVHFDLNGDFPNNANDLEQLPGIGRSTAGSIAAFSFNQPSAILDGNVKRVLARCYAIAGWAGKSDVLKTLWRVAEANTPQHETGHYNQAMMDLGATVCTRSKPKCNICPLQQHCIAYHSNSIEQYPGKKPKKARPKKSTIWLIHLDTQQKVLLEKRPNTGIWGGLWSLPEVSEQPSQLAQLNVQTLKPIEHKFSHYDLTITPLVIRSELIKHQQINESQQQWYCRAELETIGLPAPAEKLLKQLLP